MEKHARAHLSTHFYERICTRYEWCRQAPPAAHTCRQLAPRTTSGDTVRAEFGLGLESAQHPIGPTEEVAVLHRFAWLHILERGGDLMSCPEPLPATVGVLASTIADGLSDNEVALLAALFTQLGDSLALILALRACQN